MFLIMVNAFVTGFKRGVKDYVRALLNPVREVKELIALFSKRDSSLGEKIGDRG
jgi:hypothetical protein